MGRIGHERQGALVFAGTGTKNKAGSGLPHPVGKRFRQDLGVMAAGAGRAGNARPHQFPAGMAISADQAALLVDIGRQFVIFDAVGPEMLFPGGVGGSEIVIQVVFEAAVVVKPDGVAVMTGEALSVARDRQKLVRCELAVLEFEMAGGAAGAVGDGGIRVALVIEMTTQAAASQEVVGQPEDIPRFFGNGDLRERLQVRVRPEGAAHKIDEILQGKMRGLADFPDLLGMAGAAGGGHGIRMRRFGDQTGMGSHLVVRILVAPVTGSAGHIMVLVQFHGMAGGAALDGRRLRRLLLWHPVRSTTESQSSGQADVQFKFGKITDKVRVIFNTLKCCKNLISRRESSSISYIS